MSIPSRVRQQVNQWTRSRQAPPDLPLDAVRILNEPMLHQFRILSVADQIHSLNVYRELRQRGATDDLFIAGLIHDVGKACMKCRITSRDRIAHVLLSKFFRAPYSAWSHRETTRERFRGLHRLATHAQRGALATRQAGYSERVAWLVEHHEDHSPHDADLRLLQDVDNREACL